MPRIAELKEGEPVNEVFQLRRKQLSVSKNGNPYLVLRLGDKTGEIEGKMWEDVGSVEDIENGDFVRIKGMITTFHGNKEINIKELTRIDHDAVDISEFLPSAERSIEEMLSELRNHINSVGNYYLHTLLLSFFEDEEFMSAFKRSPAAKGMHHVFIGGLLQHTLEVTSLCRDIAEHFDLDRDILITAAILHDIGKIHEFVYDTHIDYSTEGRLIGHITLGIEEIDRKINSLPGFPEEKAILLKHMVLSHHGYYEFGSPRRPKTVEALVLYYLDDLNAKVSCIKSFMEKEGVKAGGWSSYHKILERYLYRTQRTDDREQTAEERAEVDDS